jgi:outer membrane protein OmpA-like peptidoglycan-associated protein
LSPGWLAFNLPGSAWLTQPLPPTGLKAADLQNLAFLPKDFASEWLGDDFARHLSGINEHLLSLKKPKPTQPTLPSVEKGAPIWLIGTAKEVTLKGLVPSVEVIQALQATAQKTYPKAKIITDLKVSPSAPAVTDISHTLYFPDMPELEEDGQVGVALLGESWISRPLYRRQIFDAEALRKQGLLPEENAALLTQLHDIGRLWKPQITPGPEKDSYIEMVASAGRLRVTGEVTDDTTRSQILKHIRSKWTGWKLESDIHVVVGVAKTNNLEKTLRSIPVPPEERTTSLCAQALLDEDMRVNLVHSIYFRTGVSGFSNDGERAIRQMKKILEMMPNARFEMIGHTDNVGNLDYNQKLSEDRARDFRTYAVKHGISDTIMTNEGRGPHDPLRDNATTQGKAKNRRVDILLK